MVVRMSDLVLRFFTVLRFTCRSLQTGSQLQTLPCTKLGHLSSVIIRVYMCDIYLLVIAIVIFSTVVCGGVVVCVCVAYTHMCVHMWYLCAHDVL